MANRAERALDTCVFWAATPEQAIPILAMLWVAVAGCLVTHWIIDIWAGLAFVPYLLWVTVAGALNISVARMNPDVQPVALEKI